MLLCAMCIQSEQSYYPNNVRKMVCLHCFYAFRVMFHTSDTYLYTYVGGQSSPCTKSMGMLVGSTLCMSVTQDHSFQSGLIKVPSVLYCYGNMALCKEPVFSNFGHFFLTSDTDVSNFGHPLKSHKYVTSWPGNMIQSKTHLICHFLT